ncbi:leucyl aminopeptidase [Glaciihabitans arcticus]|uniref:Probable cytosol aminopeptidase n=1 Tax=Glaciihabitans arcticus TaxID=2668039 RepID=A0A4Q9GRV6_9MICO|nr:leucyl aminopeptidase [Glaciihabitans arcticus]TBN56844.1 leucyl aminopeptidase [Glaciihabitans arcticus]
MTVAALSTSPEAALTLSADVLVIGVRSSDDGPRLITDEPSLLALESGLAAIGITGAADELRRLPLPEGAAASLALVGLGAVSATPDSNELRYASGSAARQLTGVESIVIALPATSDADVLAILEGAGIGAYAYNEHRSTPPKNLPATSIIVPTTFGADAAQRATIVAQAVHTVRNLVNAPPSHLYPQTLADAIVALGADSGVEIEVLAEKELEAGGFGGILGVGQGSPRGPRLVKLSYNPEGATKHLALVGKGITFDSGGLSLKPPTGMIGMKYDMTGSATIGAVVLAAAELGLPVRLTGFMCLAENMPSGTAARPGDVLTIRGGKTVEYLNTDAEGRIVLADGLVAASELEPDAIVDVATLTGAARVALGNRYTGAMGDEDLVRRITDLASSVGEQLWPMPLPAELRPLLSSDIADIQNIKPGNTAAGMLIAAVFLREFVGTVGEGDEKRSIPWAHLDIAGPANNEGGGYGYTVKGSTGVTVRALLALAEDFSRA